MKKKLSLVLVTLLVVGIGLLFVVRTFNLQGSAIIEVIRRFHPLYLLATLIASLTQTGFQINRLWILFARQTNLKWMQASRAFVYGQFINTFGPTGAGDVLKIVLARKEKDKRGRKIETAESTAIVLVVDKVADIGSVILLILVAIFHTSFTLPELNWAKKVKALLLGISLFLLIFYLIFLLVRSHSDTMMRWLKSFREGLKALKDPKRIMFALLMGVGSWLSEIIALQILCLSQGFSLSYAELLMVIVVLNIGIAVPISLANLGVYEASMTFALTKLGVPLVEGLAIATAHHAFQMLEIALWSCGIWSYERWQQWKGYQLSDR